MTQSSCGDVLFYGYLPPPSIPIQETTVHASGPQPVESTGVHAVRPGNIIRIPDGNNAPSTHTVHHGPSTSNHVTSISETDTTSSTVSSVLPQMVNIRPTGSFIITWSFCFVNSFFCRAFEKFFPWVAGWFERELFEELARFTGVDFEGSERDGAFEGCFVGFAAC